MLSTAVQTSPLTFTVSVKQFAAARLNILFVPAAIDAAKSFAVSSQLFE